VTRSLFKSAEVLGRYGRAGNPAGHGTSRFHSTCCIS